MNLLKSGSHRITLYYGNQKLNGAPYNHTGMDFVKSPSSLDYIVAAAKGKVVKVVTNVKGYLKGSYGNHVILEHANGVKTLYAHMKYGTVNVKVGQVVEKGAVLGYMGATGFVTGAHLHFEVRVNDKCVDPLPYFQDKKAIQPYGYVAPKKSTTTNTKEYKVRVDKKCGAYVRKEPNTKSAIVPQPGNQKLLNKGDVFVAVGTVKGEKVSGNDIWFKSRKGNYVWSHGLTKI